MTADELSQELPIMTTSPEHAAVIQRFAADLRELRVAAGITSRRSLAKLAHFSHTAIAAAEAGQILPSLAVTLAYVKACAGDDKEWETKWTLAFVATDRPAKAPTAVSPWPAQDVADGADPMDAGCHVDAVTVQVAKVSLTDRRHIIGQLELRHSRRAHAAWGRFRGEQALDTLALHRHHVDLTVGVVREADDLRLGYHTKYAFDNHWGDLVKTGNGRFFAWITVRFDGTDVAYCETDRAILE
jgi:DNA-binding XRE family transcriptional regulator